MRASIVDETRVRDAGYSVEPFDPQNPRKGWTLLDVGDRAPLMIGAHGCIAPTKADAIAEGVKRIEDDERVRAHIEASAQSMPAPAPLKIWEGIDVPPIYAPPISEDVARCAQAIAGRFLQSDARADLRDDHARELTSGAGAVKLTLYVRTAMGRRYLSREDVQLNRSTIDDESIIEGIVRALNAHES